MSSNNSIAKNTVYLTIQTLFVLVVSLYTSRVILRVLGVEDFGVYNVVGGFVTMFAFLNTSMINGIQRFYNFELGRKGANGVTQVYITSLIIQTVLAFVIILLTETFGLWYINNVMVIPAERLVAARCIFHFSVFSLVFVVMQIPYSSAIIAYERMGYYAFINILDTVLKLIIVLVIPFFPGDKLIVYGFLIFTISVINWLLFFIYAKLHFKELQFRFIINVSQLKEMLSFSGWNLFGSFSGVMKEQGINMILNLFFGPVVNAARGIAYQVNGAMMGFVGNINTASRPRLTQSYASGDINRAIQLMYSMSKIGFITLSLFVIPVVFEVDFILKIWLDTEVPLHTNLFIQLVLFNSLILCLNPPISFLVHATGIMKKYQLITSLCSLLVLPLSYFVLKQGAEPEYVFVALIGVTVIVQIFSLIVLKDLVTFSIKEYVRIVIIPILIFLLLSLLPPFIPRILMPECFLRLVVVCFVSIVSTSLIGYLIVLNEDERASVISFVKRFISL